ncbi:AraC family transcriptional regulator [Photobacterium sp. TY1-4]|uniref:AraC family transcriptional regulator n=1 Tax=Photobacterium sp. TY1-4 TaxID=2899122 RepID=UPI0021BF9210|nr:AraC family transcriptional regulator [Photobacterium sp. TY1-4]UXI04456.1 AraC family transcriptional regulator [Photobacterium sp. TY1-4]
MHATPALHASFIRAAFLQPLFLGIEKHYRLSVTALGIPPKLLAEPMALIPALDFHRWLAAIAELTQDPAFIIRIAPQLTFGDMGYLGNWLLSSPDLALAFRRINYGTSCLQSGAGFHGEQSGNMIKWCYDNHFSEGQPRLADSLRIAVLYTNTLRHFMGKDYHPKRVEISGPPCGNGQVEQFFGCEITWNAPTTKVWLDISVLEHGSNTPFAVHRPMLLSNFQLDELLNMPQPQDMAKVMYEMVTYACYYGFPTLDFVADRFQVSRQQLQRRLHTQGWTFTNVTSYVLCNLAIKYMLKDMPIGQIAAELGYHNVQSFSKAFRRQRGMTPTQYKDKLLERNLAGLP